MQIHNDAEKTKTFGYLGQSQKLTATYVISLRNFITTKYRTRKQYRESVQYIPDKEAYLRARLGADYDKVTEGYKEELFRRVVAKIYAPEKAPVKKNAAKVNIRSSSLYLLFVSTLLFSFLDRYG